jgi:hypothetical protein
MFFYGSTAIDVVILGKFLHFVEQLATNPRRKDFAPGQLSADHPLLSVVSSDMNFHLTSEVFQNNVSFQSSL